MYNTSAYSYEQVKKHILGLNVSFARLKDNIGIKL